MKQIIILMLMFPFIACGTKGKEAGKLLEYEFNETSSPAFHVDFYKLKCAEDGSWQLHRALGGQEVTIYKVDKEVADKVAGMVEKYKLRKLKEFYKPPFRVLDGRQWDLSIRYENSGIYSSGSNAWPKEDLKDGIKAINAYLESVLSKLTEDDVIGHDDWFNR